MQALAYCNMMLGNIDEAEVQLMRGLEYSRVAGEKESEIYGTMEASLFYKLKGNDEKAYKIFGALDAFIASHQYPVVGGAEAQYTMTKSKLQPDWDKPQNKHWYEEGRKMRIEEAVIYAINK